MSSFTTVLRATVMLATAVVLVKGWQLYGPSTQQVKSWTAAIVERAHLAWNDEPQLEPENRGPASQANLPDSFPSTLAASTGGIGETEFPAVPPLDSGPVPATVPNPNKSSPASQSDLVDAAQIPALLARLERLGAVDPQLAAWGSSGQLYRFCCRAAVGNSPMHTRHFESVAAEPLEAVEQVVAKVEAWRGEQRGQVDFR
jgi:hypothetical protein